MTGRRAWGLAVILILMGGVVIVISFLAADERMEAPRWVAAAAGAVFLFGGLAVISSYAVDRGVERPGDRWSLLLGALICSCFAAIASWIAFGPGERRFRIGGSLPLAWVLPPGGIEWLGRAMFGLGALLVGLVMLTVWWRLLRGLAGRPAREWAPLGVALLATGVAALAVLHATGDLRLWPANRGLRRALAAPGLSAADQLLLVFNAKLANPAYLRRQARSFGQQPYQAFEEEALLKQIRSRIAATVVLPPGAPLIVVPIVSGRAPTIDGRLSPDEWRGALQTDLGKGSTLYVLSDGRRLYVGADVPSDTTDDGFDQLRVYYHLDLAGVIVNERVHVSRSAKDAFASYRLAYLPRHGRPPQALSESNIYRDGHGASTMIGHRQFELALDLDESGLHLGVPFAAYVEVETDPVTDWNGRFLARAYAGRLGSPTAPVWLLIGPREHP